MALGGYDGINRLRSAEIYDPGSDLLFRLDLDGFTHFLTETNQWDPLPDMNERRSALSAVTYGSSVFAIGGFNRTGTLGGVEEYNFEEGVWKSYTSLATPRWAARFILTLVATINSFGIVQVHRVQGQGVCSGREGWHQHTSLGGVLHPRTCWHQACVAPGETKQNVDSPLQSQALTSDRWPTCWSLASTAPWPSLTTVSW